MIATLRIVAFLLIVLTASAPGRGDPVTFARHLALSPDGSQLAFAWAGDLWVAPSGGGSARRLTAHPAVDTAPVWSRDGERIAFASSRHGASCVYVMNANGDDVRRLTYADAGETPSDFTPDGQRIAFHARREGQVFWEPAPYTVAVAGGQARKLIECFGADARYSPDGQSLAFVRGGSNWWRRRYRGSANYDVWVYRFDTREFRQITTFDGTDRLPQWDAGGGLAWLSDRGGTVNIWRQGPGDAAPTQVTQMTVDDVRDFSISADGRTLAFTHWDKLYVMAYPAGTPRQIEIDAGDDSALAAVDIRTLTSGADEFEVSPDGKELALVVRGELYVGKCAEDKPTRRVTQSAARDRHVSWSPDGAALYFVSDREGQEDIYRAIAIDRDGDKPRPMSESLRFAIERVTDNPEMEFNPVVAPDGESLAFVRGRGELVVRTLKTGAERTLLTGWNRPAFRWSPDSKWIAFEREDSEFNPDVWIVPADGGAAPVNISQHPDYDGSPQWSADGQILTFASNRSGFDTDLYLVFLSPALHEKSTVDLDEYFERAAETAKKRKPPKNTAASARILLAGDPVATQPASSAASSSSAPASSQRAASKPVDARARFRRWLRELIEEPADAAAKKKPADEEEARKPEPLDYDLKTAWKRVRRVTRIEGDQSQHALAPAGDLIAFTSAHGGEPALYSIKWNGEDSKRLLAGGIGGLMWTLDGARLFHMKGGVPNSCTPSGGDVKVHAFAARMAIDVAAEARQKWLDAARTLGAGFYHSTLKDLDWPALTEKYGQLAARVRTTAEFNEIFNMLQGELNASHLGISGPPAGGTPSERTGHLGVDIDPGFAGPGLRVAYVLPNSPADRKESRLYPGDVILKIGGLDVGGALSMEQALVNTVDDAVIVEYLPGPQRAAAATSRPASTPASATTAPSTAATSAPSPAELVIRPVAFSAIPDLRYDAWVADNARYVEQKSAGRLGYCHIRGMSEPSFHTFERDLYAVAHGKDALIIDVRNNGGGWTADWVMAVLNVRRHAYTIPRGGEPGYPQDRLIFYSWTKPAAMMCNQYSYSNAEIVSHAFKNLKRGPLIGMTTFGAVISTGAYGLIDGATIRMPFRGWYTIPGGVDMENNGAVPDVATPETPGDEAAGRRPQLDAAIAALLEEVARAPK